MSETDSDADQCRANGWTPGTVLEGSEGFGYRTWADRIVITAVGEESILARRVAHCSRADDTPRRWEPVDEGEAAWTLECREWARVDD